MKYENTFKAIDQILWKEQGCGSELDYMEQKSWMLFLKYLGEQGTAAFVSEFKDTLASQYYIAGRPGEPKSIALDRKLVEDKSGLIM
jgi:hypothetical protein